MATTVFQCTPDELLARVSSRELSELIIYYTRVRPLPRHVDDVRFAYIPFMIAKANGAKDVKLSDFYFKTGDKAKPTMTPQQMLEEMKRGMAALGGR
jgi:hypothetical protein